MRRFIPILLILIFITSCVYFDADRDDILQRLGKEGDTVVTIDTERMKESSLSSFIPSGELENRVNRLSLVLSDDSVTGIAQGKLSSTEVGTVLIWSPLFHRAREENPRYYRSEHMSISAGSVGEGIVLFTTGDYESEYDSIFVSPEENIPRSDALAMQSSLAGVYISEPDSSFGLGIPDETLAKIRNVLLTIDENGEDFSLSGRIIMDSEDSARAMQMLLRNMLVQDIRRKGERLDVKALSGIFTYEGSVVSVSGYSLDKEVLENVISGSIGYAAI